MVDCLAKDRCGLANYSILSIYYFVLSLLNKAVHIVQVIEGMAENMAVNMAVN